MPPKDTIFAASKPLAGAEHVHLEQQRDFHTVILFLAFARTNV